MIKIILSVLLLTVQLSCLSQSDYNQQLEKAAISIADKIKAAGKKSIAVLDFENSNKQASELGSWLSSVFTTHLENNSGGVFSVKNNMDVTKAIQQIKTELGSGAFDSRSIQRLGEISGSDVIIYGIITLMDNDITVNIKAFNPSPGSQTPVGGTIVNFIATEGMRTKYDNYLEDKSSSPGSGSSSASGEGTARTSKNPNCKETNSGDYCFTNNTKVKLTVNATKDHHYLPELTLDPGQTQCIYDQTAGPANYIINETPASVGFYNTYAPGHPIFQSKSGQVYFEKCKSNTFIIR
jgi:hypothetical protein